MKYLSSVLLIVVCFSLLYSSDLNAQNRGRKTDRDYYMLSWRSLQPQTFIEHRVFPAVDSTFQINVGYNLSYDFLQFKVDGDEYAATTLISLEVYKISEDEAERLEREERERREELRKSGTRRENVLEEGILDKVEAFIPAKTLALRDTVRVDNYEQTSSTEQLTGNFLFTLDPGLYRYRLEVRQNDDPAVLRSRFRSLRLPKRNLGRSQAILGAFDMKTNQFEALNLDRKIPFGQNFDFLYWLPDSINTDDIVLELLERGFSSNDEQLEYDSLSFKPLVMDSLDFLRFKTTNHSADTLTLAGFKPILFEIQGKDLPNEQFEWKLLHSPTDSVLYRERMSSYWTNMPLSLFDVDIAIDMLRFILPQKQVERMSQGSREDKIKAFEAFWSDKDPTEGTDFNELMTEYYRRIDYAFQQFSSPAQPGFESDMGQAYIKIGPPQNRERTLMGNGVTTEVWKYPQVVLIFRSTTGFGDYELIERKAKK